MTVHLVLTSDPRADRTLRAVASWRYGDGLQTIDFDETPLGPEDRAALETFKHTPEPLLASWQTYRRLTATTAPLDTIVMSDWRGLGGLFALAQWSLPADERRRVVTVAADSATLHWLDVAGTIDDLPMPLASQIDWEVTQYRWSDEVITPSAHAVELLTRIDARAEVIAAPERPSGPVEDPSIIWAPEPVGRRSRTGEMMRGIGSVPGVRLLVSDRDETDEIWNGTTWEASRHTRAVLGDRIERTASADAPSVILLGDPFSVPDDGTIAMVDSGVPVVVPEMSAAANLWPDAPTWSDADTLAATLRGDRSPRIDHTIARLPRREAAPGRAGRISVGIPVFRDVRFLRECVDSLLVQEVEPAEILLVDDGSNTEEVDHALDEVRALDSRIRVLREPHRGVCLARNRALDEMTGDAYVFVDSDDILEPAFLARCREMMRSDASLMAVATWTRFFGAYEGIEAKPPFDARTGSRENTIISTAVLVDMAARDLGIRFAPDLSFIYCEDWHLWAQIVAAGGKFGLVPEPLVHHRVHRSSGGFMRTDLAYAIGKARAAELLRRS